MNTDLLYILNNILGSSKENPIDKINTKLSDAAIYDGDEVGIYNPYNSSIVKIRNDGLIDIFVDNNQGIRIDPNTLSINFFTNNEKHHIINMFEWIDNNKITKVRKKLSAEASEIINKAIRKDNNGNIVISAEIIITPTGVDITTDSFNLNCSSDKIIFNGVSLESISNSITELDNSLITTNNNLNTSNNNITNIDSILTDIVNTVYNMDTRLADIEARLDILEGIGD